MVCLELPFLREARRPLSLQRPRLLLEVGSLAGAKRNLLVPSGWWQAAVLVVILGFTILGRLAYLTYTDEPPIPQEVVGPANRVLFSGEEIRRGQEVFLTNGLMQYGSIFGHGGYLGPDYTADYLHRAALDVRRMYGGQQSDRAATRTVADFRTNRYDAATKKLEFTAAQTAAFADLLRHYTAYFGEPTTKYGLRPDAISNPDDVHALTAFFAWAAWATAAQRPGQTYSYTNNWPPESLVANRPTADNLVWSALSLIVLLGGSGLLFAAVGRWNLLGWQGKERQRLTFRTPNDVILTGGQRACAWFFLVMSVLAQVRDEASGGSAKRCDDSVKPFRGSARLAIIPNKLLQGFVPITDSGGYHRG